MHETNSFATRKAVLDDFAKADGWPALSMGDELIPNVKDYNIPIAGFISEAKGLGHELIPLLWCSAQPCGLVSKNAFEHIMGMMIFALRQVMPVDAVFLDLHGAMVTEQFEDGDGEILRRIRKVAGDNVPIVAALDFHANVTEDMVKYSDMLVGYRTYPHTDMVETGKRAARLTHALFDYPAGLHSSFKQMPFLVPVTAQTTLIEPAKSLYGSLAGYENDELISASLFMGFPPGDTKDTGPSVVTYATTEKQAKHIAEHISKAMLAREAEFSHNLWQPDGAVRYAMMHESDKPVIIADTQDNPGAGGSSDTVGMLEALIRHKAKNAVLAAICDPMVAALAHRKGEGKIISCEVGAKSEDVKENTVARDWKVEKLGDGDFIATGPMYGGNRMQLGPMALLSFEGVSVIITSERQQAATQAMFTHLEIDPSRQKILVLKSSVHFRADFNDIASEILIAESPGINIEDPQKLDYKHLRNSVRRKPKIK